METAKLKKFAQFARRSLMEQVSAKLKQVLADNSPARRENTKAINQLENAVKELGKEQVIERVAYTWFNRFCALRFMDVNRYTRIGVVSPVEGQFQPEILAEAKMGHIDENMVSDKIRQQVFALLDGKSPSHDPQGEAYRLLLVAACNSWHRAMSFLFEQINDYTELLMPDDLLSGNSILAHTREALTPEVCEGVEVIGWLYQFYVSEKKDEVINRRSVVKKEEIPAATQLFTPKWIVEYMVDNSLGRLWMLNRPNSRLIERMDYYIKPDQPETDFLRINNPEEIKFCDPACGSGHILAYAFDLFYAMYEEEGYEPAEIPGKILTHNLYGIEIDDRAGALAAFALTMKARTRHRRFFRKPVPPNICVLKNVQFDDKEINEYMDYIGRDLFTAPLQTTLRQFEEADNFGSLIRPDVPDVAGLMRILKSKNIEEHMFLSQPHHKVLQVLRQADYLSPKYHVVVANPPYAGSRFMNPSLRKFAQNTYPNSKTDMFAMFTDRIKEISLNKGVFAVVCPYVWMFISAYEKFRESLLSLGSISSLVRLEYNAFEPACVPVAAWVFLKGQDVPGFFVDLSDFKGYQNQAHRTLNAIKNYDLDYRYTASTEDFKNIPGNPIAYDSVKLLNAFLSGRSINDKFRSYGKNVTGDNNKFQRFCWEISRHFLGRDKWVFISKGGGYRKWFGNEDTVVNWSSKARQFYSENKSSSMVPETVRFKKGISWGIITNSKPSFRVLGDGSLYSDVGVLTDNDKELSALLLTLNSKPACHILEIINPTLNVPWNDVSKLPFDTITTDLFHDFDKIVDLARIDWDSYETSWDFTNLPLLNYDFHQPNLKATYQKLRIHWQEMTQEMQHLEKENNRIFIEAYGLQDELTPEVPLKEITLTCNPHYRYGGNKSKEELEVLLLADTMRELISYAVGCMFGRYALNKPGLILANQGETIEDFLKQIPEPGFTPDEDNVIPLLDADWFSDDITERFKQFLRVTFGEEHYEENLTFIEQALNIKGKRSYTIRDYFLSDFYNDHVRRYKKRPIYWLFSSPKGSFNALIYMHRYQPYTASTVLSYLRDFKNEKLRAHKNQLEAVSISASASKSEKAKALKEVEKVNKIITELETYERDILYPLATKQVEIDLDDGVKANYPKFGAALKKIPGLSGAVT
jgi:hypothetical protein